MVGVILTGLGATAWGVWRLFRRDKTGVPRDDPRRLAGTATGRDVAKAASTKALLARSRALRPSLIKPAPSDVGYLLGSSKGKDVWASVEDSVLVLGPPRSGKGLHVVINSILDAPGAVITTSTRPDNLTATMKARERRGPIAVFDPQHLAHGLPTGLRWSLVRGCENPLTAMIRATGFSSATGLSTGGVESGGFWEGKTRTALQALLHAAALGQCSPRDLFAWSLSPSAAADAVAILSSQPHAAPGWAESLESTIHSDPRTRDSIWMGVSLALTCLADPRVMDAVSPGPASRPTRPSSCAATGRCTCWPPGPAPRRPGHSSRRSSRTSSRPPAPWPPPRRVRGWTRRCSSRSTRSATSPPCRHCPCSWPKAEAPGSPP